MYLENHGSPVQVKRCLTICITSLGTIVEDISFVANAMSSTYSSDIIICLLFMSHAIYVNPVNHIRNLYWVNYNVQSRLRALSAISGYNLYIAGFPSMKTVKA